MPQVVVLVEPWVEEHSVVAGELIAAPEDQDINGQRVLLILGQLQSEHFKLGLHLIVDVAKHLTPEGRANHFPVHVEPAVFLALLLEALHRKNFCEVPLALGALAKTMVLSLTISKILCWPRRSSGWSRFRPSSLISANLCRWR